MTATPSASSLVPQTIAAKPRRQRRMLTPQDWTEAATELLVHQSVEAVKIEVLAKQLHITIGSFYYHFKDRKDLLLAVLTRWHETTTQQVLDSAHELPFEQALQRMLSLPLHGATARRAAMIEFAIRGWARTDPLAHEAVKKVDQQRLHYYEQALRQAGYSEMDAANKAFLVYSFQLTQAMLWDAQDDQLRKQQVAYIASVILQPLA